MWQGMKPVNGHKIYASSWGRMISIWLSCKRDFSAAGGSSSVKSAVTCATLPISTAAEA